MAKKTKIQEVYFDICDLIHTDIGKNIKIKEYFQEFETLEEFLIEQAQKLEEYT